MANVAPPGLNQFFDSNGDPLANGKLYTYDAGTLTPRTTWADAGEVSANANPVVLDAAGRAQLFFRGNYKLILKTSADVTVWTVDNFDIPESTTTATTLQADLANTSDVSKGDALVGYKSPLSGGTARTVHSRFTDLPLSVKDFGAVGDGVTNDTTAFANMISAGGTSAHLYVPPGTYLLSGITLNQSGQLLELARGATLKLASSTNTNVVYVTASGVRVTGGTIDGNRTNQTRNQTGNAGVAFSAVSNVQVDNVEIKTCAGPGVVISSCSDVSVLSNYIHDTDLPSVYGFTSASCEDWLVEGNRCIRVNDGAQADASGINLIGSGANPLAHVRVIGNYYSGPTGAFAATIATGVTVRGTHATIVGNDLRNGLMGVSLDGGQSSSTYMTCTGNVMRTPKSYGVEIGGVGYCVVSGNTINGGGTTQYGMIIDSGPNNYNSITGNTIQGVTLEGITHSPSGATSASQTSITGNMIQGAPLGIRIQQSSNWSICGNNYTGDSSSAFVLAISTASANIGNLAVVGNNVTTATAVLELNAASALTANNIVCRDNIFTTANHLKKSGSAVVGSAVAANRGAFGNIAAPAVPTTAVSTQNSYLSDATIFITAGAGSTTAVAINGTAAVTIPASGIQSVRLLAGQSITLTYTSAPTWTWFLD